MNRERAERKVNKFQFSAEVYEESLKRMMRKASTENDELKRENSLKKIQLVKTTMRNAKLTTERNQSERMIGLLKEQLAFVQNRKDNVATEAIKFATTMSTGFRHPGNQGREESTSRMGDEERALSDHEVALE